MKKITLISALLLLSASCNPFQKTLPAGIIKSVDGGVDWQYANNLKTTTATASSLAGLSISKLDFDPGSRQTVFAGSYTGGLYESQDAAATWSNILSNIYVYDFAIDALNSKTIYAAGFYANHGRVLKTTDGGGSWQQIYNEESATNPVRAIAINPLNSSQIIIGTSSGNVIKSSDGGQNWQLARNFNDQVNRILWQSGNIYVVLKASGLFKSTDQGASFALISGSLGKATATGQTPYVPNTTISFSQIYVDFTSPDLIYLTTGQGLYKTTDGGQNWQQENLPINPTDDIAKSIAVSKGSSNLVYTSVGSTIYKSLDGGSTWQTQGITSGGFINYILIDPALPQIVYGGVYNTQ